MNMNNMLSFDLTFVCSLTANKTSLTAWLMKMLKNRVHITVCSTVFSKYFEAKYFKCLDISFAMLLCNLVENISYFHKLLWTLYLSIQKILSLNYTIYYSTHTKTNH